MNIGRQCMSQAVEQGGKVHIQLVFLSNHSGKISIFFS